MQSLGIIFLQSNVKNKIEDMRITMCEESNVAYIVREVIFTINKNKNIIINFIKL